jgi:hypothetical protein
LPHSQSDPQWGVQVSPQQQQQPWQQQQAVPEGYQQQRQPPPAAAVDLQASWEAALAVSTEVLASYDVRYDVTRAARISSSAAIGLTPGSRQQQQQGAVGLGPDEVSLTAAALAAARAGRRKQRRQVSRAQSHRNPRLRRKPDLGHAKIARACACQCQQLGCVV